MPQPSWSPSTTQQLRKLVAAPYLSPNDWTPRSEAYFVFPLAQGTPGKQCGLAATGVYQPSLRSPWLAAGEADDETFPQKFPENHRPGFRQRPGAPPAACRRCQRQRRRHHQRVSQRRRRWSQHNSTPRG
ncbi:hypothetical protein [Thiolapillus sp.]|uniref:hypothetical protein n=1 Tax=Thiolapillus sp. TaxID=2017437 RepID=UPI00263B54D1|nr:hypothetical protein [Thiolapillus sp.]